MICCMPCAPPTLFIEQCILEIVPSGSRGVSSFFIGTECSVVCCATVYSTSCLVLTMWVISSLLWQHGTSRIRDFIDVWVYCKRVLRNGTAVCVRMNWEVFSILEIDK